MTIVVGEEGRLTLGLPYVGNEEEYRRLADWERSGCQHRWMDQAVEVFNWTAYRSFKRALQIAGWEHFPTLQAELPETNDGLTSASLALKLLDELCFFTEKADLGWTTFLVDTDTGEELHEYIPAYDGEFRIGRDGYNFGVDDEGFFIQESLLTDNQPMVEFIDLETGRSFAARTDPMIRIVYGPNGNLQDAEGNIHFGYPVRMHIITRKRLPSDFDHVVSALRAVCEASVQTGNPIRWH
jgi:hypothetical protein